MMKSIKKDARIAGFLYLILILTGIFSLLYVPSTLIVWDSAMETQQNIIANELLFKLGILGDIVMYMAFMFLSLALYKLLHQINSNMAISMVVLVLISVCVSFANLIPKLDVVALVEEITTLNTIDFTAQSESVLGLLKTHNHGVSMIQIFWGLWLFPFGYLVFKSNFLPKFFGVVLMIGCFGYLTDFFGYFLFQEEYGNSIIPTFAAIPHALGEIGICFWLLLVGAKEKM